MKDRVVYLIGPEKCGKTTMIAKLLSLQGEIKSPNLSQGKRSLNSLSPQTRNVAFRAYQVENDSSVCFLEIWEIPLNDLEILKRTVMIERPPQVVVIVVDPCEEGAPTTMRLLYEKLSLPASGVLETDEDGSEFSDEELHESHSGGIKFVCVASTTAEYLGDFPSHQNENLIAIRSWANRHRIQLIEFSPSNIASVKQLHKSIMTS